MSNQPQVVYVKQKGGFGNGCAIGLGIIFAIIFVVFVLPAACTMMVGKAAYDGIKEAERQQKKEEVAPVVPKDDEIP